VGAPAFWPENSQPYREGAADITIANTTPHVCACGSDDRRTLPPDGEEAGIRMSKALTLFRSGYDTAEIAYILGRSEADVYNELARLREESRAANVAVIKYHPAKDAWGTPPMRAENANG